MTISILVWIKKLRHPKRIPCGGGEITAEEWRSAATLMRRPGSNPPAPAPGSKPEPMAYFAGEIVVTAPIFGAASLLEMVREALGGPQDEEPKAAVLAAARWFRVCGNSAYAALLEREAGE